MNIKHLNKDFDFEKFIKIITNTKWELAYKLAMVYSVNKREILNLEWEDIDFENDTITFYPVKHIKEEKPYNYQWIYEKIKSNKRVYPLLKNIRELFLQKMNNFEYVFTINNTQKITANTLGRNLKAIALENNFGSLDFNGLRNLLNNKILEYSPDNEFYLCWTRFDIKERNTNIYKNYNLTRNKRFVKSLNNLIEHGKEITRKNEIEM